MWGHLTVQNHNFISLLLFRKNKTKIIKNDNSLSGHFGIDSWRCHGFARPKRPTKHLSKDIDIFNQGCHISWLPREHQEDAAALIKLNFHVCQPWKEMPDEGKKSGGILIDSPFFERVFVDLCSVSGMQVWGGEKISGKKSGLDLPISGCNLKAIISVEVFLVERHY